MCYPNKPAIKHIIANLLPRWDPGSVDLSAGQDQGCRVLAAGLTHWILFVSRVMALRALTQRSVRGTWTLISWENGRASVVDMSVLMSSQGCQSLCMAAGGHFTHTGLDTGLTTLFGAVHLSLSYDQSSPPHSSDCVGTPACIYVPSWRSYLTWKPCLGAGTDNGKLKSQQSASQHQHVYPF